MCKVMDYGNELIGSINKIVNRRDVLNKRLEELENAQQDLLHKIENTDKVNVVQGYDFYKAIHDIRVERREIKSELNVLNILHPKMLSIRGGIVDTVNRANTMDRKMKSLHKCKVYSNRQLKFTKDIRLEIKELLERRI